MPSRFEHNFRQKRAINPFMDSIGKRAINPFTDTIGKRSEYEPMYMDKRYFDSLAGQSLGKRSYLAFLRR
uniref:Uncharacterized protein n=1 Tax=Acrobeloides nanus TaxID=290746 RepID=A0A914C8B2_9BILA